MRPSNWIPKSISIFSSCQNNSRTVPKHSSGPCRKFAKWCYDLPLKKLEFLWPFWGTNQRNLLSTAWAACRNRCPKATISNESEIKCPAIRDNYHFHFCVCPPMAVQTVPIDWRKSVLFLFLTAATLPSSSLWTIFLFLPPSAEDFQLSGSFRVKKPENLLVKRSRAQVKIDEFRFCHVAGANFDIFPPFFVRFSKKRIGKWILN